MRILVCGGRDYSDRESVFTCLSRVHEATPFTVLIHGGARGADALAAEWARQHDVITLCYPANWRDLSHPDAVIRHDRHSRSYDAQAGYRRNQLMLDRGRPDLVIAFPGGPGTQDMIERAKAARVKVFRLPPGARPRTADTERQRSPLHSLSTMPSVLPPVQSQKGSSGMETFSIQPVRVQYRRGEPLRSPNGLPIKYVGRPTWAGNPFRVGTPETPTREDAVRQYEAHVEKHPELVRRIKAELRGNNLACWCPLDGRPCHADVQLRIANS